MSNQRQFTVTITLNDEEYATVQREIAQMKEIASDIRWSVEAMLAVMTHNEIHSTARLQRQRARTREERLIAPSNGADVELGVPH
ncbi:MAG: hypothetical protein WCP31_01005 [Chloroflexales bacterium]